MNVAALSVTQEQAVVALREYKAHRNVFDKRDWEIERIYRQIAKGKVVISVNEAIVRGGVDELGRPRLAIMRADQEAVRCTTWQSSEVLFTNEHRRRSSDMHFAVPWPNRPSSKHGGGLRALLPRIPPQHRPTAGDLHKYHILWEADWTTIPRDPYLLRKIGKDAWVVLAAWELTPVEMNVLRSHRAGGNT